ncbi:MAG: sugar ABC transporter permease [Thermomicrobiales bacterium]|nr:sugar ABC transporter permease [Thermomicrobiales bacterium]
MATGAPTIAASTASTSTRRRRRTLGDLPTFLLCLLPAVVFLLLTSLYPLLYTLWLSFHDWFLNRPGMTPQFVGLGSYQAVLEDQVFRTSALNTAVFGIGTVAAELILGLGLALAVTQEGMGVRVARSILLIPMIMTPVVVGVLWRILLFDKGLVNYLLESVGLPRILWFVDPRWAFVGVMLVDIWEWTPFVLIVMTAAIAALPGEPFRAAQIDGASRWQVFRYLTLPMLLPVLLVTGLLRFMDAIKVFDTIYVLTGGGPGYATEMLSSYIYKQGLRYFNIGGASAASWLFLAVVVVLAIGVVWARVRANRAGAA